MDLQLLQDLFARYPDLKYGNIDYDEPKLYSAEGNNVYNLKNNGTTGAVPGS